ncbi:hypothetical protein CRG98_028334 [Punica granatum]|uniref:Uncharacterized protein n=1 Tax=Punica granatum TaxID=22663 RepID=A0A2I0J5S0_PUNGR|nr:hypothetical protein CRG98_028334 [Punica granatum]
MECSSACMVAWVELSVSGADVGAARGIRGRGCGVGHWMRQGRRSASAGMSCRASSCLITRPGNMSVLPKWLRRGTPIIPGHPVIMGPSGFQRATHRNSASVNSCKKSCDTKGSKEDSRISTQAASNWAQTRVIEQFQATKEITLDSGRVRKHSATSQRDGPRGLLDPS